ncbi:hypothetical protein BKA93DRAFT_381266 [Sparassis latifolia]
MFFTSVLTAMFATLAASTLATPISRAEDDIVSPQITYPTTGAVWIPFTNQTVTWDTSNIAPADANNTGLLLLGYNEANSEHLDIQYPLATQFPIGAGSVDIVVPNVTLRTDYIVVLFGDSGNASPEFTIL